MARNLAQLRAAELPLEPAYRSTLVNRNVTVAGHRTSIRLEPVMWTALHDVCAREQRSLNALVTDIADGKAELSLTASIRVYLLSYFRDAATDDGHRLVGHGPGAQQAPAQSPL